MYTTDADAFAADGLTAAALRDALRWFGSHRLPALLRLRAAYDGTGPIATRTRAPGAPNNRLSHPIARYIVTVASGYLAGEPVAYGPDGLPGLDALLAAYRRASADSVDAELAAHQSLYGVGVEVAYLDADARPRCAALDPTRAFVAYDDTAAHGPLFALSWRETRRADGRAETALTAYTPDAVTEWRGASQDALTLADTRPNPFRRVPVVEYWNNADETGDYAPALSLMDAYDELQSDRVNDKQQFADSLLVFTGVSDVAAFGEDGETGARDGRPVGQRLREDKALALPDRDARVEWLTKQLNEADTQVLADALKADIHCLTMVPDLSDARFASADSGLAMRFRLLGLEQLAKVKERWFREGLRERLRLFAAGLGALGEAAPDADAVTLRFTRSLPANGLEVARTLQALRGLSDEADLKGAANGVMRAV